MREWSVPVKGSWQGKAKSKTLAMTKALDLEREYRDRLRWDDRLKGNVLTLTNQNGVYGIYDDRKSYEGTLTKIWFEDPQSLSYKVGLVKDLQLAGVAAWRKGFESGEVWPVIGYALNTAYPINVKNETPQVDTKDKLQDSVQDDSKHKKDKKHRKKKSKHKDAIEVTKVSKDGKEVVLTFKKKYKKDEKSLPKD